MTYGIFQLKRQHCRCRGNTRLLAGPAVDRVVILQDVLKTPQHVFGILWSRKDVNVIMKTYSLWGDLSDVPVSARKEPLLCRCRGDTKTLAGPAVDRVVLVQDEQISGSLPLLVPPFDDSISLQEVADLHLVSGGKQVDALQRALDSMAAGVCCCCCCSHPV